MMYSLKPRERVSSIGDKREAVLWALVCFTLVIYCVNLLFTQGTVYENASTGECVRVESINADYTCGNQPKRPITVKVYETK